MSPRRYPNRRNPNRNNPSINHSADLLTGQSPLLPDTIEDIIKLKPEEYIRSISAFENSRDFTHMDGTVHYHKDTTYTITTVRLRNQNGATMKDERTVVVRHGKISSESINTTMVNAGSPTHIRRFIPDKNIKIEEPKKQKKRVISL